MGEDEIKKLDAALDAFGELLIKRVRDETILLMKMKPDRPRPLMAWPAEEVRRRLQSFDAKQLELLEHVVAATVDTTLHSLLAMVEENEWIEISVRTEAGPVPSLRDASEGLTMDYWKWVSKFTTQLYDKTLEDDEVIKEWFEKEE